MFDDPIDYCVDSSEFFRALKRRAAVEGVPTAAAIALTYRCNFNCVHCYAHSSENPEAELSGAAWMGIIDQLAEAGCLFLLITGGEPLLRPDFKDIYLHAKKRGMLVTVFTNGSLVDESIIRLFKEYPPREVDISLYGMSAATCRNTVGTDRSLQRCLEAVHALRREGIQLALKTVVMKANRNDFDQIRNLAESLGVKFRYDVCITPQLDGGLAPVAQRLPVTEAVALEYSDRKRMEKWQEIYARNPGPRGEGLLYRCSAGRNLAFIGPDGGVHPCPSATHRRYTMDKTSFAEAWGRMHQELSLLRSLKDSACFQCEKSLYCGHCPAFCHLDAGDEAGKSQYLCELGSERLRCLNAMSNADGE